MKEKMNQILSRHAKEHSGLLGAAFYDFVSGTEVYAEKDTVFPTASTFKVFLLAELLRQCEAGKHSLQDRVELTGDAKSPGSGVLQCLQNGAKLTLEDYAVLMMILSDNSATDLLYDLVGGENIHTHIVEQACGLSKTRCDLRCKELISLYYQTDDPKFDFSGCPSYRNTPYYLCTPEKNDVTTPAEMLHTLRLMYDGKLCSEWVSSEMIRIMKQCQTNSRIPKLLPDTACVAHKTGTMDRLANDVGIVYTPKGNYALALFYNGNLASEAEYEANNKGMLSDALLAQISRDIYDAFVS